TNSPKDTAYNNLAYVRRINKLIDAQIAADSTGANDPTEVKNGLALKQTALGITFDDTERLKYRRQQLEIYFKRRTRRVPYTEVAFGATETYLNPLGSADTLRPIDRWVYPTDPTDGKTGVNYTNLSLNISGTSLEPKASDPKELKKNSGKEKLLGDRVLVSNNLPELRWDTSKNQFIGSYIEDTQDISGIKWDLPNGTTQTRTRPSLVRNLADIGSTERDGDWELAAAKVPTSTTGPVGGLRVVTGAGVYLSKDDTPSTITSTEKEILSDIEGMYHDTKPYLKMRATAVYHYKSTGYNAQTPKPIACVSSYYDPTDNKSYKNMDSLPNASNLEKDKDGKSNRGIVYPAPTKTVSDYATALTYLSQLKYNNRPLIDDGLLARALAKAPANRTISEQSAIDAQICALQILDGSLSPNNSVIPHGAIFETFFSDQRENKKVRATVLDLNLLRTKTIGGSEYLLPNSGIIYATRDDALPDISAGNTDAGKLESPVDYSDDTTRRPSAIILINGGKLGRTNSYKEEEKGLTLATNLPAYIRGDFNLHTQEEFTQTLADDWNNFYTRTTFNNNFACRSGDSRFLNCTTGDEWRPGNILADAVTLLSGDFDFTKELGYTIGSQQTANKDTTFNLIIAAGDNPAQPTVDNGGLNNLVRVIENWTSSKIKLNGAFMQVKKSAYATGTNPPQTVNNPPTRQWSYDVGLLFQSPDLFASKLAVTPPEPPDEYLREVSRGDTWVQTLLCAKETSTPNFAIEDEKQRPDICQ
ncbi:MAG: hormogonium polysaccharide biosynthesis protein HpsA, partial [Dolichospermum sp.]